MMALWGFTLLALVALLTPTGGYRKFEIDWKNNQFLLDGVPFRYVSGSMHYFRVPQDLWRDRMQKMTVAGLNTLQTYIEWNSHEPQPGIYNFEGNLNLTDYIVTAQDEGLLVILRAGPFIDAEREMGGLPFWLLREDPNIKLRANDATYMKFVTRWFQKVLPMIKPLLYNNGGPVIMVQVENEYGSWAACDWEYKAALRDLFRQELGDDVVFFTTDGNGDSYLTCGYIPEVFATVDFGSGTNVTNSFHIQHLHQPHGPSVNSEYYPGWLDHWGQPHAEVKTSDVTLTLDQMLAANASVNIYMFHGGTSFGFSAGADGDGKTSYLPCPTSYDYDAPLTEAGDPTHKYFAIRDIIGKYLPLPSGPPPAPSPKGNYGQVKMQPMGSVWRLQEVIVGGNTVVSDWPMSFEELGQSGGFMGYETTVPEDTPDPTLLEIKGLRDRGYVFLNETYVGLLSRSENIYSLPVWARKGQQLQILIENQGRICFGSALGDFKGIISNVTLGGKTLKKWTMIPLPFNNTRILFKLAELPKESLEEIVAMSTGRKAFLYTGTLVLPNEPGHPRDTFLRLDGWTKGVAFINEVNLGRYWPVMGPQVTLYVPKTVLMPYPKVNRIVLFEQEEAPCDPYPTSSCEVKFVTIPNINGSTPYSSVTWSRDHRNAIDDAN